MIENVDFITTPGYLDGPGAREAAGLPPGSGPYKVITDLAIMGFHDDTKRMQVESLHPDVTFEQVQAKTGFELSRREPLEVTSEPTPEQLEVLRREVDPQGYIIGRQ